MQRTIGKVKMTRQGTRQIQALATARGAAMHHRVGHIRMKLKPESEPGLKRLDWEIVALREQFGASRQFDDQATHHALAFLNVG